jgi:hypothetical protein
MNCLLYKLFGCRFLLYPGFSDAPTAEMAAVPFADKIMIELVLVFMIWHACKIIENQDKL